MKRIISLAMAVCIALMLLNGCQNEAPDTSAGQASTYISIGTGGVTGTYYPMGGAIAELISQNVEGYDCTAESTGGTGENIQLISNGQVELAMCDASTVYQAQTGTGAFKDDQKKDLVAVTALYNEAVQVVTLDPAIQTLADLRGKRVAVGAAGSGTEIMARSLLKLADITYEDIQVDYLGFSDAASGLKDRTIDAAIIWAGVPTSGILELGAQHDIYLLDFSDDMVASLQESHPFCVTTRITKDIYSSLVEEANTVSIPCILACSRSLDEDLVYDILTVMFDHLDVIASSHACGADISLGNALAGLDEVEMHPGAVRFFTEKGMM